MLLSIYKQKVHKSIFPGLPKWSKKNTCIIIIVLSGLIVFSTMCKGSDEYSTQINSFLAWLKENRDAVTGLPHSHVGDIRFKQWTITYDSAVVSLAYIAMGELDEAKRVSDYYINNSNIQRLGGIIEAFIPTNPITGKDWSVRTGANLWMGIAGFHLYIKNNREEYLNLAVKIAGFAISLQNTNRGDPNYGGISLGPKGDPQFLGDQHLSYDMNQPSFYEIYATEINIDAYALFNMLYQKTEEKKYKKAMHNILIWLKTIAYNKKTHRLNRGFEDDKTATDVQCWGISALGIELLDTFETNLAEKMIEFVEDNCISEVVYTKPDGSKIKVRGVDFIDRHRASELGRSPLVTPEWTFHLINAYRVFESFYAKRGNFQKENIYSGKRKWLIGEMLRLAVRKDRAMAYPYATQAEAVIGHEYKTPREGNLSAIGTAYAILALKGYDPLVSPDN